jgi:hypothetical protein
MRTEHSKKVIQPAVESVPSHGSLLILGLSAPDVALFAGWTVVEATSMRGLAGKSSVTWGKPGNGSRLAVVRINVCDSPQIAGATLSALLEQNELAHLEQSNIGAVSFTTPPEISPAIYFIRGNVCATVSNFGVEIVSITDAARTLDALIDAYPQSSTPKLTMTSHRTGDPRRWRLQISAGPAPGTFFQLRSGVGELTCEQGVPYLTFGARDAVEPVKVHLFQIRPYSDVSTVISAMTTVPPPGQSK